MAELSCFWVGISCFEVGRPPFFVDDLYWVLEYLTFTHTFTTLQIPMKTSEYLEIVGNIKAQIASAQQRVILNANKELVMLYWNIGKTINKHKTWGSKFIENMARDIKSAFPNQRGFSERNLKYMSKFANIYNNLEIVQKVSAQLSWSHNVALLDKIKDDKERLWYAEKNIEMCCQRQRILKIV